ncbi:RHS repeat domain-containing protein [Treponema sp. OMZ 857]|uniref:RHS repeat domain-containing protein n=1 Tax=Treponema sp. OMZ 857 TaxID=1643513 RepID=UPI0020A54142|nr:RHS repeat-associated core domain-containing protein [Treponema sp. OMZ 857]UTC43011.1 RHS repeat-associated core domain-containing protein [Treponema sp. OMZ 857]
MDIKDYFYQRNYSLPRTAIEAEILFAARIMQVRFLKRLSGKTPLKQNSSGEKIGAESAVLHFVFFIVIVNKMQQSAKEGCLLKRNTVLEVFPLTAGIAGSGKTVPFEKRRSRYKETAENKAEAYRVYVEHLFSACDAVDARIFSKGDGNMTRKISTTNLPGARGNAYPKAELDYSLDYEYDPAYAHRLIHAGNRYYRYDANGNITAEKDGPFTEDDEFVFTYSYDPETDVYGTDYGFGLDAPKETEETHPENLFAYRRNYTWNEKNLLTKSSDRSYTVHYRYGEDGQRALKYTEEGRSETLYFNNFYTIHIPVQDKNNPQGLRVHKHIFVGNSRLVTAMTHTDNNGDNAEQREKRYYYHSDHLGSAQFVTDWRGKQYEHIEYTPYGELWIEEVAAGLDKLPFRFTGKEMDEETGLYYYGARYLDPKYSRWLSGDPALSDYIPKAPIDDEAKKHNENLPGMGGVFNVVNLHLYHYAGNNPVKYTDPDGKITWNRAEDRDIHYNSLYNPDLRNCYAVFSINTEHYRATRETNTIKNHSYSLSGTKDIIEIRQGGIEAQTITTVTLKRFNINLDGKNYDVFKMEGESNIRLLFISNTKHLKASFFANDPLGDDKSIYNGFYNLNNFIDFLKGEDANKLAFAAISFGLAFFLNPVEANFTDGLFNHLSSKVEGQVPTTSGIDKDTLDLLSQIIEEYER